MSELTPKDISIIKRIELKGQIDLMQELIKVVRETPKNSYELLVETLLLFFDAKNNEFQEAISQIEKEEENEAK